ncbi:MAG: erythromycin esterase family protein [Candidatus Promineifilaceae bacterium]
MTKIVLMLLGLSVGACGGVATPLAVESDPKTPVLTPDNEEIPPQTISWLRENIIPVKTTQPGADKSDLMPLKEIIGDARIVALGEATHGTHEFFQMKHRLLEFLVEEMGFTTFAIEAYWAESALINDYVHTGKGDVDELLANLGYWPWQTQEVFDLIEWVRVYNQSPDHAPVSFYGFDMQNAKGAIDQLVRYLEIIDTETAATAREKLSCFGRYQDYNFQQTQYAQQPAPTRQQCSQDLQAVYDGMLANQRAYESLSSPGAFAFTLQTARVIQQAEKMATAAESGAIFPREWFNARDAAMAANVIWLLDHAGPEARIVLWAHNVHVQAADWEYSGIRYETMGTHLRQVLGDQSLAVGFNFHDGAFNAVDYDSGSNTYASLQAHQAGPPVPYSIEEFLHRAETSRFILDLRQITAESPSGWLLNPHWLRFVGSTYDRASEPEDNAYVVVLPEAFDVIIYFEESTPSHLLP